LNVINNPTHIVVNIIIFLLGGGNLGGGILKVDSVEVWYFLFCKLYIYHYINIILYIKIDLFILKYK
jgi:hypothetical protein